MLSIFSLMSVARVVVRPVRVVEEGGLVSESHAVEWLRYQCCDLRGMFRHLLFA